MLQYLKHQRYESLARQSCVHVQDSHQVHYLHQAVNSSGRYSAPFFPFVDHDDTAVAQNYRVFFKSADVHVLLQCPHFFRMQSCTTQTYHKQCDFYHVNCNGWKQITIHKHASKV